MHEEYKNDGVNYVRIDKRKARIKYNEGKIVYLVQDGLRLESAWISLYSISKVEQSDFDNTVNHFQYYNNGCGVKYFIRQEDCV